MSEKNLNTALCLDNKGELPNEMIDAKFNAVNVCNMMFVNNKIDEVMKQIRLCEEILTKLQTNINTLRPDHILLNKDVIQPIIDNFDSDVTDHSITTHLQ